MKKFMILTALILCGLLPGGEGAHAQTGTQTSSAKKVLRYAFRVAETGMDPVQLSDVYSRYLTGNMFDAPYITDYLAEPAKLRPNVAEGMPVITDNFQTWTVKIRPGIYFNDDPAFNGKKRELRAQDFVYSYKRHYDPKWKSPNLYLLENAKVIGMTEVRKAALAPGGKFDYDKEVEGIRALDRYTFQFKFNEPQPRFDLVVLDAASVFGAVAREVVEKYGDKMMEHPVGTGPFRLAQWKRSSKIVLERNPTYRDDVYVPDAPLTNPESQAIYELIKGKKLPLVDEVEISIIEEDQPRWLAFLNGEHDFMDRFPNAFANIAMPNNEIAPNLKKKGIKLHRGPQVDVTLSYFGMENPIVGGYTPDKVALRRAITLAYNAELEIRGPRRNQAVLAQGIIPYPEFGFDPNFKTEQSEYSPARAKALLDLYGYVDKDGDGWRDMPDGSPLVLEYATQPDAASRELIEVWKKCMDAVNIRMKFTFAKWPENLKSSNAGKLMMWGVAWLNTNPDGDTFLSLGYGPNKGQSNHARFDLPAYNSIYVKQRVMASTPERLALMKEAEKLMVAYAPYRASTHRIVTDMSQPWLLGYKRNPFLPDWWKFIDIDTTKLPK